MTGFWSIIVPEATTNLVTNPSIEIDTTGYTAVGGSVTRYASDQRRESASLRIVPTAGVNDGAYYGTVSLTSGQSYTFSLDIYGTDGEPYTIYFANTSGVEQGTSTDFTAIGDWERQEVTWACDSTASYRLYITKNNDNNTDTFYIDGMQCENLAYSTTYIDGNQDGGSWDGAEHASTSERDAQSRIGGRVYNFDTYGFYIDDMPGIGMPPILHQTQEQPILPGSLLRGSKTKPRIFDLIATQIGDTHEDLHSKRKDLLNAIKPDLVLEPQPFILRYTGANSEKPVEIKVVYDSGFQFTQLDGFTERDLPLRFIAYDEPYFYEDGNVAASLITSTTVTGLYRIIAKIDSVWQSIGGTNANGNQVIVPEPDGGFYMGGYWSQVAGVSNTAYIAKWDGSNWSALGTGMNDKVEDIVLATDGSIYACGFFTTAGGTSANLIAKWNGSSWSALGTGLSGLSDYATCLAIDHDGILYAGGNFDDAGGTSVNYIAKWDGSSWSAVGTGLDNMPYTLAVGPDNKLYAGGIFLNAGGSGANRIASWDGSSWDNLGTGLNNTVNDIVLSNNGILYTCGLFTTAGGSTANYTGTWNGQTWTALGSGMSGEVIRMHIIDDYRLIACGFFSTAGGITIADGVAIWNGSTWTHIDLDVPTSNVDNFLFQGKDRYVSWQDAGFTDAVGSYPNTVTNDGTRKAFPKIVIERSGGTTATVAWIKNETTGATLYCDYDLLDGETLTIDLKEGSRKAISSYFGDVWRAILRASDVSDFYLTPGSNTITVFVIETGSPTITAYMQWRNTHWSADGVAT